MPILRSGNAPPALNPSRAANAQILQLGDERVADFSKQGVHMKIGFLGSLAAVLAGTGVALAQAPATSAPASSPPAAAAPETLTTAPAPAPGSGGPAAGAGVLAAPQPGCGDGGCGRHSWFDCDEAYRHYRLWGSLEYLLWDVKDQRVPPLASINTVPLTLPSQGGVTTVTASFLQTPILPGGLTLTDHERSGVRLTAGFWLDDDHTWGIYANYWELEQLRTTSAIATQTNNLDINTPFVTQTGTTNTTTTTQNTSTVTTTGVGNQPITTTTTNGSTITTMVPVFSPVTLHGMLQAQAQASGATNVWGAEINCITQSCYFGAVTFDLALGLRYIDLTENLLVHDRMVLRATAPGLAAPITAGFDSIDAFATHNEVWAPQVAAGMEGEWGPFWLRGQAKVGVGGVHQNISLFGTGTDLATGAVTGGFLVPRSEAGAHTRDRYTSVSEVTLNLGYALTPNVRLFAGYNYMYVVNVLRPGDQVSVSAINTQVMLANQTTTLNVRQFDFKFSDRDIWLSGVNFGVDIRY
jgi:hypothetical protein